MKKKSFSEESEEMRKKVFVGHTQKKDSVLVYRRARERVLSLRDLIQKEKLIWMMAKAAAEDHF